MASTPIIEPKQIIAGDTITWKKTLSDYPASGGYTLKYRLINSAAKYDITAAASGDDHLITITSATSSGYAAGSYIWSSRVEKGLGQTLERYTLATGTIEISPDLADKSAAFDTRSHVKRTLDALEAAIEGRASRTDLDYEIQTSSGTRRRIQSMSHDQLFKARSYYKRLYRDEQAAENAANGIPNRRKVLVRF